MASAQNRGYSGRPAEGQVYSQSGTNRMVPGSGHMGMSTTGATGINQSSEAAHHNMPYGSSQYPRGYDPRVSVGNGDRLNAPTLQNQAISGKASTNSKDSLGVNGSLSKAKPTGIPVISMTINAKKISTKWKYYILKFHYVKKLIYIEFESEKTAGELMDKSEKSMDNETVNSNAESSKGGKEKARIDLNFSDVSYFNVQSEDCYLQIETFGKYLKILRESSVANKKSTSWEKISMKDIVQGEATKMSESIKMYIQVSKETMRGIISKNSILYKLKQCGMDVYMNKQLDSYGSNDYNTNMMQQPIQNQSHRAQYRNEYGTDNNMTDTYQNDYSNKHQTDLFHEINDTHIPYMKTCENEIRLKSEDNKKAQLMEYAPKFKDVDEKNSMRCPVYSCFKIFTSHAALNSHINRNHKELESLEVKVLPNGEIKYPSWVIDHVLRAIKWFPNFSNKVAEDGQNQLNKIKGAGANS